MNPMARMKPVDMVKLDFSKAKTRNQGGDQSQERDKNSRDFTMASWITIRAIAGNIKEILQRVKLQTRSSKRARMVPP
jgi:hypothetical protein